MINPIVLAVKSCKVEANSVKKTDNIIAYTHGHWQRGTGRSRGPPGFSYMAQI